jgi:ubiquinone/menaquinone biosynthesis C-methylase UbiE
MTPDWQLPPGTDRGLWDYVASERVAREYDEALVGSPLLELDLRFADKHLSVPGRLIDLGCGTGRALVHFAHRGFQCTGVDLSETMLEMVRQKAERDGLPIEQLKANLVELDVLPPAEFDSALCLFSTLGMIRGAENRRQFLGHVRRILKPGGVFVLHVHNASYHFGRGLGMRGTEPGDRVMPQHRGGAELTIHHYSRREIIEELKKAGFRVREMQSVSTRANGELPVSWFWPSVRAHGYLIAAEVTHVHPV